jgi:hypothetical protein
MASSSPLSSSSSAPAAAAAAAAAASSSTGIITAGANGSLAGHFSAASSRPYDATICALPGDV